MSEFLKVGERLLHGLLRTYLAETVAWEPPRLTAEQRLAEYRAHLILSFGDLGPTVRHRAGRASGSATAPSEAAREAASGSTSASDEAVLRATTPEALAALYLSQLASVARRLTGAGGDWSGPARVARAYRGVGAHLHLSGSKKISSPTLPGLRNVYYIVLRDSDCPDGLWTRGGLKRLLAGSAEGMATTSGLRRAIVRGDVEALASAVHADRPLPPLYFVLAASSTEEQDHYAVTYLLKVRTNWLVRTPAGSGITWESLVNSEGEAADFRSCLEGPAVDGTPGRPIASHAGLGESLATAPEETVSQRVQSNALTELGLSQAEPGLMREYIELWCSAHLPDFDPQCTDPINP
eukprot:s163_g21.t1